MHDAPSLIDILRSVSLFSGFQDSEYGQIVACVKPCSLSAGDLLIREGDSGESMYLVAKGRFEVWKRDSAGGKVRIGFLEDGAYLGELSLIDHLPRSASVEAVSDAELYELQRSDFLSLLQEDPALGNRFYVNCLRETFNRFRKNLSDFTFSQSNLRERTAVLDEINSDLQSAKHLQHFFIHSDFLDRTPVLSSGIRQSYLYHPCFEIGGDFINIRTLGDGGIGVIIADVAGHGITASLATGVIKSAFSLFSDICAQNPSELVRRMNNHLYALMKDYFATCFYAYIDGTSLSMKVAKAGHPYPLVWKGKSRQFQRFECKGLALGIMQDSIYAEAELSLEPGDKVLFYTDGIVEQMNGSNEMFGDDRFFSLFSSLAEQNHPAILQSLFDEIKSFSGRDSFDDDITLLLLEF